MTVARPNGTAALALVATIIPGGLFWAHQGIEVLSTRVFHRVGPSGRAAYNGKARAI
jgi:hypothetical protein